DREPGGDPVLDYFLRAGADRPELAEAALGQVGEAFGASGGHEVLVQRRKRQSLAHGELEVGGVIDGQAVLRGQIHGSVPNVVCRFRVYFDRQLRQAAKQLPIVTRWNLATR